MEAAKSPSVQQAAQHFVQAFATGFKSCALARVFALATFDRLPVDEQNRARKFAATAGPPGSVQPKTPTLSLLGTAGTRSSWNDRWHRLVIARSLWWTGRSSMAPR